MDLISLKATSLRSRAAIKLRCSCGDRTQIDFGPDGGLKAEEGVRAKGIT